MSDEEYEQTFWQLNDLFTKGELDLKEYYVSEYDVNLDRMTITPPLKDVEENLTLRPLIINGETAFCLDDLIEKREKPLLHNMIQHSVQNAAEFMVSTAVSIIPMILLFLVGIKVLSYSLCQVQKGYETYMSFDQSVYDQNLSIVRHFNTYPKFEKQLKHWVWKTRCSKTHEVSTLLLTIKNSSYLEDPFYQYEIIQIFPEKRKMNELTNKEAIQELIKKIEQLNKNYWSVEF